MLTLSKRMIPMLGFFSFDFAIITTQAYLLAVTFNWNLFLSVPNFIIFNGMAFKRIAQKTIVVFWKCFNHSTQIKKKKGIVNNMAKKSSARSVVDVFTVSTGRSCRCFYSKPIVQQDPNNIIKFKRHLSFFGKLPSTTTVMTEDYSRIVDSRQKTWSTRNDFYSTNKHQFYCIRWRWRLGMYDYSFIIEVDE